MIYDHNHPQKITDYIFGRTHN